MPPPRSLVWPLFWFVLGLPPIEGGALVASPPHSRDVALDVGIAVWVDLVGDFPLSPSGV